MALIDENLQIDPLEAALMDVARAIQITPTMHDEATSRYQALADFVDREGSPLEGKVLFVFPSGSFAIHAAIRARIQADQHDVDAVLELLLDDGIDPADALDLLYRSVRGSPGSRYHDMVELNSRCVTVTYADGVTIDLMPVDPHDLDADQPRIEDLFHSRPESNESYRKEVNPKGFAELFNHYAAENLEFAKRFATRRYLVENRTFADLLLESGSYDADYLAEKAETEEMPDYLPLHQRSPRVVALQLIKRFRNKRYKKHDDHKGKRMPPSVVLAALALRADSMQPNLVDELMLVAAAIRSEIVVADAASQLLVVRNPSHEPDEFTDRWPEDHDAQRLWAGDLEHLIREIRKLQLEGFDPQRVRAVFDDLFGEKVGEMVLRDHFEVQNKAVFDGKSQLTEDGRLSSPAMPSPAIVKGGMATGAGLITPARANTSMGGDLPDDDH